MQHPSMEKDIWFSTIRDMHCSLAEEIVLKEKVLYKICSNQNCMPVAFEQNITKICPSTYKNPRNNFKKQTCN